MPADLEWGLMAPTNVDLDPELKVMHDTQAKKDNFALTILTIVLFMPVVLICVALTVTVMFMPIVTMSSHLSLSQQPQYLHSQPSNSKYDHYHSEDDFKDEAEERKERKERKEREEQYRRETDPTQNPMWRYFFYGF